MSFTTVTSKHGHPDLLRELAARTVDVLPDVIVDGGLHTTSGSTSATVSHCRAYVQGSYIEEGSSKTIIYSGGDGTYWLAVQVHRGVSSGAWTRVAGTHYIWQKSATLPTLPADAIAIGKITVASGAISLFEAIGDRIISAPVAISDNIRLGAQVQWTAARNALLTIASGKTLTFADLPIDAGNYQIFAGAGTVVLTSPQDVNVSWWGAKQGDDCASPMQKAITAAVAGSRIFMPAGTYDFDSQVQLKSNIWLDGGNAHIRGAIDDHWLVVENANVDGLKISNFYFENLGAVSGTEPGCIRVRSSDSGTIVNSIIQGNRIKGFSPAITLEGTASTLEQFYPTGATSNIITEAIDLVGTDGRNYIIDNVCWNDLEEAIPANTNPMIYVLSSYTTIARNRIENSYNGILIGDDGNDTIGCLITENRIINCWGNNGIYASRQNAVIISNNYVEHVNTDGIAVRGSNCVVTGNRVVNCFRSAFRVQHVTGAGQTCFNNVISNNVANLGTVGANFLLGDNPSAANPGIERLIISGNMVSGPGRATGPLIIIDNATSANADIDIYGNTFYNVDTTGASAGNQGPYALVVIGNPNTPQRGTRCSFHDNRIINMAPIAALASSRLTYGCDEYRNLWHFSDSTRLDTRETEGWVRVQVSSAGAVSFTSTSQAEEDSPHGCISTVTAPGATGVLEVTFKNKVWVSGFAANYSGGQRLDHVVLTVTGNTSADRLNTSQIWTVTLYDIDSAGAQVAAWPASGTPPLSLWFRVQYFTEFFRSAHT